MMMVSKLVDTLQQRHGVHKHCIVWLLLVELVVTICSQRPDWLDERSSRRLASRIGLMEGPHDDWLAGLAGRIGLMKGPHDDWPALFKRAKEAGLTQPRGAVGGLFT